MNNEFVNDRKRPVGAELVEGGVHFRVWSPRNQVVRVVLIERDEVTSVHDLAAEENGYFSGLLTEIGAGQRYALRVDDDPKNYPDPASCFQPDGVHGASEVTDSSSFTWSDESWPGVTLKGQVIYELHIGTWTPEGTWNAAIEKLSHLVELGVTLVEVMPVAEFSGEFGWGYDGVSWFAPTRLYGRPDDFRRFVNEAHRLGLGVILDVVYNHFGPVGNYTGVFSPHYVTGKHATDWGDAINFDDEGSEGVREFVISNASYWIREYHLDGLRLDAIHAVFDDSRQHIVTDLGMAAREAAGKRNIVIFSEDEDQRARNLESVNDGGFGVDGVWNDDFHHACRVAATGHAEYYYSDYLGTPQELISAVRFGYLYQGQWNQRRSKHRGTPVWHLPAVHFVNALQNHDQVSNSTNGSRGHQLTSPGRWRALTGLMLLSPGTPLLFMGQEFMSSKPFLFFADHDDELAEFVREGRWNFIRQFPRSAGASQISHLDDPAARETFEKCVLDWGEAEANSEAMALHRDLLYLRSHDPIFSNQDATHLHGAVMGPEALLLRWLEPGGNDRLILLNLGRDQLCQPASQPLLAPPTDTHWKVLWSSESTNYGGMGTAEWNSEFFTIPGHSMVVLCPALVVPDEP